MARSKPTWSRNHGPEQIARALLDAEFHGDRRAAEMHGVHRNTLVNWRGEDGPSDAVRAEMDRLRVVVRLGWIDEARDARRELVMIVLERARVSKNLRSTTEALRRVSEVVMAHEILSDPGAEPHLPDQPEAAGEAEGEG